MVNTQINNPPSANSKLPEVDSDKSDESYFIDTEAEALKIFKSLIKKPKEEDLQFIKRWLLRMERKELANHPLSIMEHSALTYLLLEKEKWPETLKSCKSQITNLLKSSWKYLRGKDIPEEKLTQRLPRRILRKGSKDEILFHQSLFHRKDLSFLSILKVFCLDYIPELKDLVIITLIGASFFTPYISHLSWGLLIGYLFSSVIEHFVHLHIGHAGPKMRKLYSRTGYIGRCMLSFHYEHSTHHGSVAFNYVNLFAPSDLNSEAIADIREKNRERILNAVQKKGGDKVLNNVIKSNYGLSSSNVWITHLFFIPMSLLCSFGFGYLFSLISGAQANILFHLGFLFFAQFWISASSWYHPYLHFTRRDAYSRASRLMRWFLQTRMSNHIARSHRAHHSKGGMINQNLNPGAALIFGWCPIKTADLIDLKSRGALY